MAAGSKMYRFILSFLSQDISYNTPQPQEGGGGGIAHSVERTTPGEEVLGSISAVAARSLLVGSVSV